MNDTGHDRQWRWDGQRWLWWNGYSWQEGDPEADNLPPVPEVHEHQGAAVPPAPTPPPPTPPPTPPPPTPPSTPPRRGGLGGGGIVAVVLGAILALVLLSGAAVLLISRTGGDDSDIVTLQAEPISTTSNPFTPPAGTDAPLTPAPVAGVQSVAAATVGLYGGTVDTASCNKDQLVAFLAQNPDKAAAWAGVLGIAPSQIAQFVAPLTPVILRSDTAVTNHGFDGGKATAVPAVLQAGTAVLVNTYGQPVVKCYCGNPLTPAPANLTKVRYTGPTWPTFVPGAFSIVTPSVQVITVFRLTNIVNGEIFDRPSGTAGTADATSADAKAAADKAAADKAAADAAAAAAAQAAEDARAAAAAQAAEDARAAAAAAAAGSGADGTAVGLLTSRLDSCTVAVIGGASDYTPVAQDPALSFSTSPGAGAGLYRVTMADSTDGTTYTFTVNVNSGAVTPGNEGAAGLAMECPGVFD